METYIVEQSGDSITLGFKDANMTLITPLMKELDGDENVELVRFIDTHPELDDKKLMVKVRKGDPKAAIESASKKVSDYYSKIE